MTSHFCPLTTDGFSPPAPGGRPAPRPCRAHRSYLGRLDARLGRAVVVTPGARPGGPGVHRGLPLTLTLTLTLTLPLPLTRSASRLSSCSRSSHPWRRHDEACDHIRTLAPALAPTAAWPRSRGRC
eukprot:scaffold111435_cov48-Phaeocystis_antarctica.AAC.1